MFCNKCGAQTPDDSTFCGNCGNSLQKASADATNNLQWPDVLNTNQYAANIKKSFSVQFIILIVVGAITLVAFCALVFNYFSTEINSNVTTNANEAVEAAERERIREERTAIDITIKKFVRACENGDSSTFNSCIASGNSNVGTLDQLGGKIDSLFGLKISFEYEMDDISVDGDSAVVNTLWHYKKSFFSKEEILEYDLPLVKVDGQWLIYW